MIRDVPTMGRYADYSKKKAFLRFFMLNRACSNVGGFALQFAKHRPMVAILTPFSVFIKFGGH